jgi:hypothetical protein
MPQQMARDHALYHLQHRRDQRKRVLKAALTQTR